MNISEVCIRRPVLTTLMTASLIVFGAFAYRLLPVAALPAVDFPTIQITATLPGASPETMAASVASPIERQLSTISGISSMTSSSSLGSTQITIQFDLGRNIDGASLDVQTALAVAQRRLPVEMTTPPFFRKVNPGDFPVLYVSMRSDTMPLSAVDEYAETVMAPTLSQLPGVAQVLVYGAQKFAVRVQVDPVAAAARNISLDDIRTVVAKANSSTPVGSARKGQQQAVTLLATGAIEKAADYRDVVVAYRNGAPVKLNEVARVIDSVENDKVATWFNDSRAIVLAIQRQPDANTVEVVDLVRDKLPAMRAQIPPAIQMTPLFDRSISIRAAVVDVQETLAIAISLVIMVIFLFLRKVSATIIPALAVPVSLIGTCAAMYAFGFSINNMTLLALTLSVGFVVDDAIVMLENIVRHIEGGMRPFEAALKGSREIGFTIVSITFSLIAVFIPVLLMGGMVGRVFREFAVSVSVAIIVSGFVSLTLTPMLCARVLKSHHAARKSRISCCAPSSDFSRLCCATYEWTLDRVLAYKSIMLMVTLATIAGTIWLYIVVPKGFFPTEDTGYVIGITEGKTDIAFDVDGRAPAQGRRYRARRSGGGLRQFHRRRRRPEFASPTAAACWSRSSRAMSATACREILARLRQNANVVAGIQIFFQPIQNINLGGKLTKSQYQYTLQSNDTETLYRVAPELRDKIAKIARPARRHHRSLHQEPADHDRCRSREVGGLWRQRRSGAPGTLQRLRHASGRHHLHAGERLSGHPGKHAGIPGERERSRSALSEDDQRHDGAALGGDAFRADGRTAADQPSGPAAGGDDLVQPCSPASRSARRSMRSRSSSAKTVCRPPSPPASRAPRRCSRIHCAGRAF